VNRVADDRRDSGDGGQWILRGHCVVPTRIKNMSMARLRDSGVKLRTKSPYKLREAY
jgi:hypothetical protein